MLLDASGLAGPAGWKREEASRPQRPAHERDDRSRPPRHPAGYGHNWPAMLAKHNDRPRVHVER